MKAEEILKQIGSVIAAEKVESSFIPPTDETPYPRLIAFLGNDYRDRERILTLTAHTQSLVGFPVRPEQQRMDYIRVQFHTTLPFKIKDKAVFEVGSLLHFINRMIELPGFEMDELENTIFYRYVLLSSRPENNASLYISILGLILMILDLFTEAIEKLATGQASFNEMLAQMIELTRQLQRL